jgi:ATP-binding cassette subfamily B protein
VMSMGLMGMEPAVLRRLVLALQQVEGSGGQVYEVVRWTVVLGAMWLGSALFNRATEVVELHFFLPLRAAIQAYLFSYLMEHAPRYFQENFAGRLSQKVKDAAAATLVLIYIVAHDLVRICVIMTIGLVLLGSAHWGFAAAIIGWSALFLAASAWFARGCIRRSRSFADAVARASGQLVDSIANAELVRSFVGLPGERRRLARALGEERAMSRELRLFLIGMRLIMFSFTILFQLLLVGLAVREVLGGRMTTADFVMVLSLSTLVAGNVYSLGSRMLDWFEQLGNLGEAIALLTQPHEIVDRPDARPLGQVRGELRFEDVRFAHADGTKVFDGLSLCIAPGEKVALVGPSGAGKSTLIKLLRRHYPLNAGRILIDGRDIADITWDSLHAAVAEVPQSPGLFHRSIGENILYAAPGAGEAALRQAARQAHCHEFVGRRRAGFDAVVGEHGVRLSGGERQRVAIARAFLKDAPILVLDEATSALDSETEHLIQESLWQLMEGRTVIAIAHRLSTIRRVDRVLYIDQGRILEEGSQAELLAKGGHYARLWARQSGGFLPEEGKEKA